MDVKTRVCNECGQEFPATADYFPYANREKSWLRGICIPCFKEIKAARYESKMRFYYRVIEDPTGDFRRGATLDLTSFRHTLEMGFFPHGMIVQREGGELYRIQGRQKERVEL